MKLFRSPVLVLGLFLPVLSHGSDNCIYGADLFGRNVVPPAESEGYAYVEGWFVEPLMGTNCYTSDPDSAHVDWTIHFELRIIQPTEGALLRVYLGRGEAGETGEIVRELFGSDVDFPAEVEFVFDPADCEALRGRGLFVLVTTEAYPEGELRGAIEDTCADPTERRSWGRIRTGYR